MLSIIRFLPRIHPSCLGNYVCRCLVMCLISVLFVSCSVQKRKYLPGYHFSFFSRSQKPVQHKKETAATDVDPVVHQRAKVDTLNSDPQKTEAQQKSPLITHTVRINFQSHWFHKTRAFIKENPISEWNKKQGFRVAYRSAFPEEPEHKLLVTALIGLILSIISILLIIGGVYLILVNPELLTILLGVILLIIGALGLLVSFFLDIVALIQKADEPGNYGVWMAFVSMALCLAAAYIIVHGVTKK